MEVKRHSPLLRANGVKHNSPNSSLSQCVTAYTKRKNSMARGVNMVNMGELFANPRLRDVHMRRVELSESERVCHGFCVTDCFM